MVASEINLSPCGLDWLTSGADLDDLAFMEFVIAMQESDAAISAKLGEIRSLNKERQDIAKQIQYLNEYLSRSGAKGADDLVYVDGGLENPKDPKESRFKTAEEQRHFEQDVKFFRAMSKNPFGKISMHWSPEYQKECADAPVFRRSEVENQIEKLRNKSEELNSASTVMMTELQRFINKRAEAVQFTTNVLAKSHEMAMGIIANLK
jgi:hypothetical protein